MRGHCPHQGRRVGGGRVTSTETVPVSECAGGLCLVSTVPIEVDPRSHETCYGLSEPMTII